MHTRFVARFVASGLVAALAALYLVPDAAAHGGMFPGPKWNPGGGGTVGGGKGNPGKTKGGGGPSGPSTPGGGGPSGPSTPGGGGGSPSTPPDDNPPPTTPSSPGAPTTGGGAPGPTTPGLPKVPTTGGHPGAPSTGGGGRGGTPGARTGGGGPMSGRRAPSTTDRWESWWLYTRELYLGRHNATAMLTSTPGALGRSNIGDGGVLLPDATRRELLPVLANALKDSSSEVADSAAIAIGRTVATSDAGPVIPLVVQNLAHPSRSPREAAVLGLGILGGPEAAEPLRQIALDTPEGRKLCDATGPLDDLLRGLAILALGFIGTEDSVAPLTTIATTPGTPSELQAAAVVALGLQRSAAPAAIASLARMLDERSLDRDVRAQIPIAIARLPSTSARGLLPKLLEKLADKRTGDEMTRSIVLALGHIATADDAEVLQALTDIGRKESDASTRQFALLALGRIFEQSAPGDAKAREATMAFLLEQVRNPAQHSNRPWAALALGLAARGDASSTTAAPSTQLTLAARKMIETFEDDSDPSLQGAIAIGLALMHAPAAAPVLRARLAETSNPGLRGHLATALGLLNDRQAIEPLRALLADPSLPPSSRIDVARGLALAGDSGFEARLLDLFAKADDLPSVTAYAKALGLAGSRASAQALRGMAENTSLPELQRAFAVVAIGLLAEKTPLPWNVPFLVDANYTVPLRPLEEVLDIL
jgi:HEAT repeat protein